MSVNEDENALSSLSQDEKNVEKTAKNLRGRAKSSITRMSNFVNNDKQTFQKHDLCNKLEKIEMIYADFDKADAMLPLENSEMEEFEIKYYETKAKLQKRLEKLNINIHTNTQAVVNNQIPVTSTSTIANNFKLPRLNIQPFSGNYKEWMSFKDLYISLVHGNEVISNIQKFQYLKGLLIGEPASIIKHIPISEDSYHEAWDKLLNRYDKKKQIVSSLIKTFMEIPSCSHTNSANLRNIADTSDEIIRGLNSIGAKANERDIWLIYILLQKVDTKTREEWAHHTVNEDFPTFEKFIQFINDKCYSLELYFESEESKQKRESFSNTTHKSVGNNITCPMCKSNHFLFKCCKYKDLSTDKRKQFVRKFKLCTNCLSEKHSDLQCNSTFRCHICKQKHHSSLHDYNFQSYSIATTNSKTGFTKGKALENDSATDKQKDSKRNTSLNTAQTSFALLPTASVYVYDSMGQKHLMRLMVDSGSESTFVTESCINSLGIKRRNARLPVRGLSKKEITVTKGVAELRLVSIYNKDIQLSINAFILNKLTDTMPSQKLNEKHFLHLKNLQLADPHFAIPNKVDIILGADYFFSILLPTQVTCAEASLIAQNSIFGFLVSGKLPDDFPNK